MKKYRYRFASFIVIVLMMLSITGRTEQPVSVVKGMLYHPEYLNPVFDSLRILELNKSKSFAILHIGDSHIQGNHITNQIQAMFCEDFGTGSKGLVFPFQVAKTNTMAEIRSSSTSEWEIRRNTQEYFAANLGISGREIVNLDDTASFQLRVISAASDYYFDEAIVFYRPMSDSSEIGATNESLEKLKRTIECKENGFVATTYKSEKELNKINLTAFGPSSFHGLSLNNTTKGGITYHVAGVNGARYSSWAKSNVLALEASYLNPQLIILSLGTNDAQGKNIDLKAFTQQMDQLVNNLKRCNPKACLLLTTPPDSYYRSRYVNKEIGKVRQEIIRYAEENKIACWDLYAAMGGERSISQWRKKGLASADMVHFTKEGYKLQGELFYKSFIKQYRNHVSAGLH